MFFNSKISTLCVLYCKFTSAELSPLNSYFLRVSEYDKYSVDKVRCRSWIWQIHLIWVKPVRQLVNEIVTLITTLWSKVLSSLAWKTHAQPSTISNFTSLVSTVLHEEHTSPYINNEYWHWTSTGRFKIFRGSFRTLKPYRRRRYVITASLIIF